MTPFAFIKVTNPHAYLGLLEDVALKWAIVGVNLCNLSSSSPSNGKPITFTSHIDARL